MKFNRTKNALGVSLALFGLVGCMSSPTIKSTAHNSDQETGKGLSYYLPMRYMQIIVERKTKSQKLSALEASLAQKQTAENSAKSAVDTKRSEIQGLARELEVLIRAEDTQDNIDGKRLELRTAEVELELDIAIYETAKRETQLSRQKYQQTLTDPDNSTSEDARVTLSEYVPDTSKRYVAKFLHSQLRDDQWQITTTKSGLLTKADVTPHGRLDDIVKEIAKTALVLTGALPPGSLKQPGEETLASQCPRTFRFEYYFDPAQLTDEKTINQKLRKLCSDFWLKIHRPQSVIQSTDAENVRGLAYRREVPFQIQLLKCHYVAIPDRTVEHVCNASEDQYIAHEATIAMLPNGGPIEVMPYEADPFANRTLTSTFANGMLTDVNFTQPSGALAVAQTPLKVVSETTTALGDLLSLRMNTTSLKKNQIQNETESLTNLTNRLKAQQKYDQALKLYLKGKTIPAEGSEENPQK